MSAGAQILSRVLDAPGLVAKEIWTHPENFGRLYLGTLANAKQISACLSKQRSGVTLARCAAAFAGARLASQEIDKLRL